VSVGANWWDCPLHCLSAWHRSLSCSCSANCWNRIPAVDSSENSFPNSACCIRTAYSTDHSLSLRRRSPGASLRIFHPCFLWILATILLLRWLLMVVCPRHLLESPCRLGVRILAILGRRDCRWTRQNNRRKPSLPSVSHPVCY
jgi:hypothetical protein